MIDLKNYLIDQIKDYDSDIDTRPGSNFRDVVINPLASVLESYQADHNKILNRLTLTNVEDLNEDELDAIAANFLVERAQGSLATGKIELFFNQPLALNIPENSRFQTEGGVVVETTQAFTVTRLQMELNTSSFPLYSSGQIPARAVETGETGNLQADVELSPTGDLAVTPSRAVVSEEFTGGSNSESNANFLNRIKNTVFNKTLASPSAIKEKIRDQVPTIVDSEVIGAGNPLMLRDLTSFYDGGGSYLEENFNLVYSGQQADPYSKQHIAYVNNFRDSNPGPDVDFPIVTGWTQEFTDQMYKGLYLKEDVNYASNDEYALINETFEDAGAEETLDGFQLNDGTHPDQKLYYTDEIRIEGNALKLGTSVEPGSQNSVVNLTDAEIQGLITDLSEGNIQNVLDNLNNIKEPSNFNNLSPVVHKPIDYHAGITMECEMSTNDETEDGEMAYITVLRNDKFFSPHDGFGLAWRKQPGFLVRMQNSEHTQADLDTFEEQYEGLTAADYIGQIKNNPNLWKYNVYLVDNDILQEEVFINSEEFVTQTSGVNDFLAAKKVWIEPDLNYYFRIKIYETFGVEAWVHEVGAGPGSYTSGNTTLDKGASYPNYVPVAGETITRTLSGGEQVTYTRGNFGIGVGQTRNYQWTVDNLFVRSFIQTFPMHLFKFKVDTTQWSAANPFNISYYGVGFDPTAYADAGNAGHSKVKAAIWDPNLSSWEDLGSHTATIGDTRSEQLIDAELTPLSNYLDGEDYLNIAATAANTGPDFPSDIDHELRSYYITIDNGGKSQAHQGNMIDVYCHDPKNYKIGSVTHTLSGTNVNTDDIAGFPGHLQEVIEIREFVSGTTIDPNSYEVFPVDDGTAFSGSANYTISFEDQNINGTIIEIVYRYWASGTSLDAFLNSEDNRYPAIDVISKTMPPAIVQVNKLQFSGALSESAARKIVADYLNSLTSRNFDKSDLVDLLYDNGANFVDLEIDIDVKQYANNFSYRELAVEGQTYVIPFNITSRFYSEPDLLGGVELV